MTADTPAAAGETDTSRCWCCGRVTAEDALVHLGNHPEVGICVNCAHFLGRKARDLQASAMRQRLRGAAESARREVMARGLAQPAGDRARAPLDQSASALVDVYLAASGRREPPGYPAHER